VGLGEKVDIDPPEISITSHDNGDYVKGTFSLTGNVTDDIKVKSVELLIQDKTVQAEIENKKWLYEVNTSRYSEGE